MIYICVATTEWVSHLFDTGGHDISYRAPTSLTTRICTQTTTSTQSAFICAERFINTHFASHLHFAKTSNA